MNPGQENYALSKSKQVLDKDFVLILYTEQIRIIIIKSYFLYCKSLTNKKWFLEAL